jgi:hypothetical protein
VALVLTNVVLWVQVHGLGTCERETW